MVSLLLTFSKYTASEVSSFSTHHFCFSVTSVGVNTSMYQNTWDETNKKMNAGEKTIEEKQTILLKSIQRLR